ncbi:hypothetical protein J6590_088090 [Homalodisca vitripennis]|nr:hypothetical protein J6590_088090 [Homalodisca vitripennis]
MHRPEDTKIAKHSGPRKEQQGIGNLAEGLSLAAGDKAVGSDDYRKSSPVWEVDRNEHSQDRDESQLYPKC